jgi:imidazoleglycerol-phosphate dehydratase / histidinol-phosphatase
MKKILFIDRDGTLILETDDFKIEKFEKLIFYPGVFYWLKKIVDELHYELVMVTNQDGLGTEMFPEEDFRKVQHFIVQTFANEGLHFTAVHIDKSFPDEGLDTRKPGIGMLRQYLNGDYDIKNSLVIGDRITDVMLAKNMGCKCVWLNDGRGLGVTEVSENEETLKDFIAIQTRDWQKVYEYLKHPPRKVTHQRKTKETDIQIALNLDGNGNTKIDTGLGFFDHMLEQLGKHSAIDLAIKVNGDLHIDEHHTIEDTAIALGEALLNALGDKKGIERYGFFLPMDDVNAWVGLDFSGRAWLEWEAKFKREKLGDVPTEMFEHFFKSFSDAAKCNLHIKAKGKNEHHKIEAIFKAVARSIKQAVKREGNELPSTKGVL